MLIQNLILIMSLNYIIQAKINLRSDYNLFIINMLYMDIIEEQKGIMLAVFHIFG